MRDPLVSCALALLTVAPLTAVATSPGVPRLAASVADYAGYAVEDLPSWYESAALAAADNTPADNPITNAGAELGRVLFYDGRLSHDDGTSCASCHSQSTGFSDPEQFSEGFDGGLTGRHSMGLTNARFYQSGRFFWDERAATLEAQVLAPIQDAVEMGSNLTALVAELQGTEFYPVLFERAFGDSTVTSDRIAKSLAQFVRSMVSYQSPFDDAVGAAGGGPLATPDFAAVPEIANPTQVAQGHTLFAANCGGCHGGRAQVANDTHNIGLDATNTDQGAGDGEFKVPSLRNIAERGRYMHDGRFASLEEVIEFYSSGVENNPNLGRGLRPGGLGFTAAQQAALVAYLRTFSDEAFLTSDLFSNPFVLLAGDYNDDGVVDQDDYAVWASTYGTTDQSADGNADGVVNAADFTLWRDNLGRSWLSLVDAASGAAAIPEPATAILAAVTVLSTLPRRRRAPRRRRTPCRRRTQCQSTPPRRERQAPYAPNSSS
ncbi:MAG: cytochrome c peroxidase [Lacipirellulaceae bacterium]